MEGVSINHDNVCELTVVMPCLNEAETIGACIRKANAFCASSGIAAEVLIADNGSTDGSQEIATALGARVVRIGQRGYGAALQGGIEAARGRYVIMGDADDSYDFSKLDAFVARLREGADLVIGNRFRGGIAPGAMPALHRYFGNPGLSWLGRTLFHLNIGDLYCGLRGFSRDAIRGLRLQATGMEFAYEMIVRSALEGLKIVEVPTTLSKDGRSRPPHLRTWRDGWRTLRFLLMYSPRWLFLYPGLALIGFGVVAATALMPGPVQLAHNVKIDIHTFIVACVAILVGLQSITFGMLASRYAAAEGFLPPSRRFGEVLRGITLERMLLLALLLFLGGAVGMVFALKAWADVGFGPLAYGRVMRTLTVSLTGVASGLQLGLAAFLAGIMEIEHKGG